MSTNRYQGPLVDRVEVLTLSDVKRLLAIYVKRLWAICLLWVIAVAYLILADHRTDRSMEWVLVIVATAVMAGLVADVHQQFDETRIPVQCGECSFVVHVPAHWEHFHRTPLIDCRVVHRSPANHVVRIGDPIPFAARAALLNQAGIRVEYGL